jgi:hypothetical protein
LNKVEEMSPSSLQIFIDTTLTLTSSVIPNSNYVIMVNDWNCLKYFSCFCTVIIRCTETFWSPCIYTLIRNQLFALLFRYSLSTHAISLIVTLTKAGLVSPIMNATHLKQENKWFSNWIAAWHGQLTSCFHRFKITDDQTCLCKNSAQTAEHLLGECELLRWQKQVL